MSDYISREETLKAIQPRYAPAINKVLAGIIESVPEADVKPVVRGRWIMRGGKRYCSVCGDRACVTRDTDDFWYTVGTKYCPECGAEMVEKILKEGDGHGGGGKIT